MTSFDLRALIRDVCATSTITDPATLAKEVGRRIGRNEQREALEQALPTIVQHVISRARGSLSSPGGQLTTDDQGAYAAGAPSRSRKVAGIRETWRRMLRERLNVGPAVGDWKFLADCTTADLAYAAQLREDHARRNAAKAAQLRRLAELLDEHQVTTVGELPEGDLGGALGAAA